MRKIPAISITLGILLTASFFGITNEIAAQDPNEVYIVGTVWNDYDHNGTRENVEDLMENIPVVLRNGADTMDMDSTTTDEDGFFLLSATTLGDAHYLLRVGGGGGMCTLQNVGTDDLIDSDVSSHCDLAIDATAEGGNIVIEDAGIIAWQAAGCGPSSGADQLTGLVWEDLNENGSRDTGEPGVEDITVEVYNDQGVFADSTVTNTDGSYSFPSDHFPSDHYYVRPILTEDYSFTVHTPGESDIYQDTGTSGIFPLGGGLDPDADPCETLAEVNAGILFSILPITGQSIYVSISAGISLLLIAAVISLLQREYK